MNIETLKQRKEQLQAELDAFVQQANRQIAAIEGRIAELDYLIQEIEKGVANDDKD